MGYEQQRAIRPSKRMYFVLNNNLETVLLNGGEFNESSVFLAQDSLETLCLF